MTDRVTFHLDSEAARARAIRMIERAPLGYSVTVGEETRTLEQNRLMWPLIKDMREQIEGMDKFTPDQTKLRFLNALDNEMQMLPELEGGGMFVVGQSSSKLTKRQFSDLIELMFAYGAKHDVQWSRKSQDTIATVRE